MLSRQDCHRKRISKIKLRSILRSFSKYPHLIKLAKYNSQILKKMIRSGHILHRQLLALIKMLIRPKNAHNQRKSSSSSKLRLTELSRPGRQHPLKLVIISRNFRQKQILKNQTRRNLHLPAQVKITKPSQKVRNKKLAKRMSISNKVNLSYLKMKWKSTSPNDKNHLIKSL